MSIFKSSVRNRFSPAVLAAIGVIGAGLIAGLAGIGAAHSHAAEPTRGLLMGELVGRDARVVIYGTEQGSRFDIHSLGGGIVAAGLTAEQVAGLLPGQDPRGAMAQEPMQCGPLMMVEPDLSRAGIE